MRTKADRDEDLEIGRSIERDIAKAVADERERCAKIAEAAYADPAWHQYFRQAGGNIAAKIRNPSDFATP